MVKLLGVERMRGEFQERPYDNLYLYCQDLDNVNNVECGIKFATVSVRRDGRTFRQPFLKIRTKDLKEITNGYCESVADLAELVGHELQYFFNDYGNISKIDFISA